MRLTLRTMLAYMDEILEPADAKELGQKISESEFANGLVHRIRGCMRRLRLPAPPLDGKGMGLDPNTVAEYLDNTMPADRVADFEKVCLESDIHLAEVGASHQILTLVLGEAAAVETSSRERVYRVISAASQDGTTVKTDEAGLPSAAADASTAEPPVAEAMPAITAKPKRKKPKVPDYLRDPKRSRLWPIAATVLIAALATAAALWTVGPFDSNHPVLGFLYSDNPSQTADASGETSDVSPPIVQLDGSTNQHAAVPHSGNAREAAPSNDTAQHDQNQTLRNGREASEQGATPPGHADQTEQSPPDRGNDALATTDVQDPLAAAVATTAPVEVAAQDGPDAKPPPADNPSQEAPAPRPAAKAVDWGRFTSEDQVLVRLDRESGSWQRLTPRAAISAGDDLLALPTFRPQILSGPIHLTLDGGTRFIVDFLDSLTPQLNIDYGRALILARDRASAQIGLVLAGHRGVVRLADAESTMAVEVQRFHSPGTDPLAAPAHEKVSLIATRGKIEWTPDSGTPQSIEAGQAYILFDNEPGRIADLETFPAWTERADLTPADRMASTVVHPLVDFERPASLTLSELSENRKMEVKQLAARCLAHLGQYDAIIAELKDEKQKLFWMTHFETLSDSLARSRESAAQIHTSLEKLRGDNGAKLYRMLWRYSPEDLRTGEAAKLVDYLDHGELDYRVLAFENLRSITGRTGNYQPQYTRKKRGPSVNRWRSDLEKDLVVFKNPPPEIPPRQPAPSNAEDAETPAEE